jgi:glyoxylase-like metal-dependent hydrolase (beta-lactamase superfamily II)
MRWTQEVVMSRNVSSFALGAARVTVIDVGILRIGTLRECLDIPEGDDTASFEPRLERPTLPLICVHVALPDASILVDAGFDDPSPSSPFQAPGSVRTLDLLDGLAEAGVDAASVTHVVVTHAHGDHFAGLTVPRGGRLEPRFPNARVFLGQGDWDQVKVEALRADDSFEARTLGVIEAAGLLVPVREDLDLAAGARVLVTPGESPGHLVARFSSGGQVLYCLGDLYHDTVEVERPAWMFADRDAGAMLESRRRIAEAALAESALLVASHIDGVGRLAPTSGGVAWTPA